MDYWEKATFMLQQIIFYINVSKQYLDNTVKSANRKCLPLSVICYACSKGQYAFPSVYTQFISACAADNITAIIQCCVFCLK